MPMEFMLGAKANCADGFCGTVSRAILDPGAWTVTHLVIEPRHHQDAGRLVPVALVGVEAGGIKLRCTLSEFSALDPAEEIDVAGGEIVVPGYGVGGVPDMGGPAAGAGLGAAAPILVSHAVPEGETEVEHHESVHAVDGAIGQVKGFVVNSADHAVTHVILREGHLWGRKQVAIPGDAIASVTDGIRLNITKKQVEDLPPASVGDV